MSVGAGAPLGGFSGFRYASGNGRTEC